MVRKFCVLTARSSACSISIVAKKIVRSNACSISIVAKKSVSILSGVAFCETALKVHNEQLMLDCL